MKFNPADLRPFDVQIFSGRTLFDTVISVFTFSRADHVEVTLDEETSIASRNGKGADYYTRRDKGLRYVLRPNIPVDVENAVAWFEENLRGKPYGYFDLLQFVGITVPDPGVICSQTSALVFAAGGAPLFNQKYPAGIITPRDHLITPRLDLIWSFKPNNLMRLTSTPSPPSP